MRVLLSTYGSCGEVEPMVGLAMQLRALGTQVRVCAPPHCATAAGCGAPDATVVVPAGVGR
jgi:vancomycin aglycone glucosyltransferase